MSHIESRRLGLYPGFPETRHECRDYIDHGCAVEDVLPVVRVLQDRDSGRGRDVGCDVRNGVADRC